MENEPLSLEEIALQYGRALVIVDELELVESKSALKDPDGGLTAAGRAHFKKTEGANLKPGVKGAADTPDKMRRKGSFLTRFFTNPSGPMKDEKGRPTRLALSAVAWGEPVPKNAEDAARLADKGRNLLEKYKNISGKSGEILSERKALGPSIGATSGPAAEGIDHDSDGMVFDGTPQETRAKYKKQSNADYEKRRRKFVKAELARQGIKRNRRVEDRSKEERDARARARAVFDKATVRSGAEAQAQIGRANTDAARDRRNQAQSDRLTGQAQRTSGTDRKPADRYPNPSKPRDAEAERMERMRPKPRDVKPADRYPNPTRPDTKPADRYPEAPRGIRPEDGVNNRPKPSKPKRTPGRPAPMPRKYTEGDYV